MTETKTQQECPYCHGHADSIHHFWDAFKPLLDEPGIMEYITLSDDECYLTTAGMSWGFTNFRLSYCPKCGRKLGEDDDINNNN